MCDLGRKLIFPCRCPKQRRVYICTHGRLGVARQYCTCPECRKKNKNHLCALFDALGRLCTQPGEMDGAISGPQGVLSKLINGSRTQCLEESFRADASRAIT